VDEVEIDRDLLALDVRHEDQSHREFVVVHQDAMNFHHEQVDQWMGDLMIFFAEDVRKSFLEIPFVTPSVRKYLVCNQEKHSREIKKGRSLKRPFL
jgi:hypothetical protein